METPKKKASSKRGRKPKESDINDFCRVCNCSFKNYYGSFCENHVSTENIFSLFPLVLHIRDLGYVVENGDGSSRVCAKCATKIRRAADLKVFLDAGLMKQDQLTSTSSCLYLDSPEQFKRTCNTPTGSNRAKSSRKNSPLKSTASCSTTEKGHEKIARKRIIFGETSQDNNDQGQCKSMCVTVNNGATLHANSINKPSGTDQSDKEKASHFSNVLQDNLLYLSVEDFKPKSQIRVIIPQ
jgi:hypothetical protein